MYNHETIKKQSEIKSLKLGATLYMPSLHKNLADIGNDYKFLNLRTVVFCTEDSIRENDLIIALENIKKTLPRLDTNGIYKFIRPRNPEVLKILLDMPYIERVNGFVLPKADFESLPPYFELLKDAPDFEIMPTLETKAVFDQPSLFQLRDYIFDSNMMSRIITFRIGSLDLLNILSLRRNINRTIYDSPLGHTIDQLITVFKPAELELSAPGFEGLCHDETLSAELSLDISRGLFAKTAIHPSQVDIIHAAYRVGPEDLEAASAIVDPYNPAVFRLGDRMCEKAVHTNWALTVLERAKLFGTCQLVKEAS